MLRGPWKCMSVAKQLKQPFWLWVARLVLLVKAKGELRPIYNIYDSARSGAGICQHQWNIGRSEGVTLRLIFIGSINACIQQAPRSEIESGGGAHVHYTQI